MSQTVKPLALAIVLAIACGGSRSPTDARAAGVATTIRSGSWGGPHVSLTSADSGATLDFDCAHGSIPAPLSVGADGSFRLSGTFVQEHGGPIGIGATGDSQAATYSGTTRGDSMSLSIDLIRDKTTVGPFTLEFGNSGQIFKCH